MVATLLDLTTGTPVAVESMLNKQQPFGADVIARISATMLDPAARDKLRQLAQETLAELATAVCQAGGVSRDEVYEVALAGNATMVHLVLGIDPEPLGVAPFIMSTRLLPEVRAHDLGVPAHPQARAVVFPAFGAYVGGDITAGLLASGMDRDPRVRLFIDIGTNCEIVLGGRDWLLATAAPAGPAFEGASIRCGMRAADGAIEAVAITEDGDLKLTVIGDTDPEGPVRLRPGRRGSRPRRRRPHRRVRPVRPGHDLERFPDTEEVTDPARRLADRLTMIGKERVFVLHWSADRDPATSVYLSQRDIRELQFAKAAIATGWRILLEEAGLETEDIKQVLLAGQLRLLPQRQIRHQHRPGPRRRHPPHHRRRQRGGRGRQDGPPLDPRPRRRPGPPRGGELCRAQRPERLQRPLHRPAQLLTRPPSRDRRLSAPWRPTSRGDRVPPRLAGNQVRPLPAALHNRPQHIKGHAERMLATPSARFPRDHRLRRLRHLRRPGRSSREAGVSRLPGLHCYDLYAGAAEIEQLFAEEPGTYLLTDYLIKSFERAVIQPLGLDRHPELWTDYFGHYTRLVWLAQRATTELEEAATRIASRFNLPLTRIDTGTKRLEEALALPD